MIQDNFLHNFRGTREWAINQDYTGSVNPADGVLYPGILADVPDLLYDEVVNGIQRMLGRPILPQTMFLRLSTLGMEAPHQAHNDEVMGDFSFMLYLNTEEQCTGGTELVVHKDTGMYCTPHTDDEMLAWAKDTNVRDAWRVKQLIEMKPNRAAAFNAHLMHRAAPIGGFGSSPENGRLALTCFFKGDVSGTNKEDTEGRHTSGG
jgi:hypothetical protein